jgi:DUF971 family protein
MAKLIQKPKPQEIRYSKDNRVLEIEFDDGHQFSFPAEFLRVESPSAEVQGHSPSQKNIIGGKINVGINAIESVGNYAIRIRFDDNHETGIFSWNTLHDYGEHQIEIWERYMKALEQNGLNRES